MAHISNVNTKHSHIYLSREIKSSTDVTMSNDKKLFINFHQIVLSTQGMEPKRNLHASRQTNTQVSSNQGKYYLLELRFTFTKSTIKFVNRSCEEMVNIVNNFVIRYFHLLKH